MSLYMEDDSYIKEKLDEQLAAWGNELKSIEITWFAHEYEYWLELHFSPVNEFVTLGSNPPGSVYAITIVSVPYSKDNAFEIIKTAGRNLYYRLRKEYPMLKRDLKK